VLGEANWANAKRYLERAVEREPNRITHRLDLAGVYADRDDRAKAREQLETIAQMPAAEYNDPRYKEIAAQRLAKLR
jgi:regulator of sirC expression with transglutaminase-like and TPR domain